MVRQGQVRELDRDGNNRADDATDFGKRKVGPDVTDARRNLSGGVGGVTQLFRCCVGFFIAISLALLSTMTVLLVLHLTP